MLELVGRSFFRKFQLDPSINNSNVKTFSNETINPKSKNVKSSIPSIDNLLLILQPLKVIQNLFLENLKSKSICILPDFNLILLIQKRNHFAIHYTHIISCQLLTNPPGLKTWRWQFKTIFGEMFMLVHTICLTAHLFKIGGIIYATYYSIDILVIQRLISTKTIKTNS